MNEIDYYEEYLKFKFHFSKKNFLYKETGISGINERYSRERKIVVNAIKKFKDFLIFDRYKQFLVANLSENPKLFIGTAYNKENFEKLHSWRKYMSNPMEYFSQDVNLFIFNYDEFKGGAWMLSPIYYATKAFLYHVYANTVTGKYKVELKKYELSFSKFIMLANSINKDNIKEIINKKFKEN